MYLLTICESYYPYLYPGAGQLTHSEKQRHRQEFTLQVWINLNFILWALIWYWDHLKNFIAEIPQGPLGMSIGTICMNDRQLMTRIFTLDYTLLASISTDKNKKD